MTHFSAFLRLFIYVLYSYLFSFFLLFIEAQFEPLFLLITYI